MLDKVNVKVSKDQKLWIEALYRQLKQGKHKNYRALKAELYGKIAADFDPKKIDERLLTYGTNLTILGIEFIDPEFRILGKSEKVILAIKEILIQNMAPEEVVVEDIINKSGIKRPEIELIVKVGVLGFKLWTGISTKDNETTRITVGDDQTFDRYLNFVSVEDVILRHLKEEEEKQKAPPKVSKGKRVSLTNKFGVPIMRYEDADPEGDPPIQYKPVFMSRVTQVSKKLCFVLMPFNEEWSDGVYENIKNVVSGLGLQVLRADDLHGRIIIEDIWTKINLAGFVIVDVTNRNPNVMYELGIVDTIGKPAILLTQEIANVPFDLKHHRHYDYNTTMIGIVKFKSKLEDSIKALYSEHYPEVELKDLR